MLLAQMEQYRDRAKLNNNNSVPNVLSSPAPKGKTALGYVNLGLPSNLNLGDDNELNWAEKSFDTQSIDEEYRSYGFGVLTRLDVDILKFWEVCLESPSTTQSFSGPGSISTT
jgi:hypothetical protein